MASLRAHRGYGRAVIASNAFHDETLFDEILGDADFAHTNLQILIRDTLSNFDLDNILRA